MCCNCEIIIQAVILEFPRGISMLDRLKREALSDFFFNANTRRSVALLSVFHV